MNPAAAFEYPASPHEWKHGPRGYADYSPFRPWLRDEFQFRCVFCLRREQWDVMLSAFHLDHFIPQSVDAGLRCDYENLLYVCSACNQKKGDLSVPNPSEVAFGQCLGIQSDGTIIARNDVGELLVGLLGLDDERHTRYRKWMMDILRVAAVNDQSLFVQSMRFPSDLPDLSRLRPPGGNSRPEGVAESYFALRERGDLPETY